MDTHTWHVVGSYLTAYALFTSGRIPSLRQVTRRLASGDEQILYSFAGPLSEESATQELCSLAPACPHPEDLVCIQV